MGKNKILITALLLLTAKIVGAQTFEFQYHDESIVDGGTIEIHATEDEFDFEELCCESNPSSNPNYGLILKPLEDNISVGTATICIKRNTLGASVIKWCMGGNCTMFNDKTELTKTFNINNGIVQVQFDAENIKNEGSLLATLTVSVENETHNVNILFINGETSGIIPLSVSERHLHNYYTPDGRRTAKSVSGLYITNGNKMMAK